ncbi:response regulator transcription factor [Candidatus Obscuribacterales bacterium]|nr:response regulator transcription factor [Candidatus Obscuribacterales bacterium]
MGESPGSNQINVLLVEDHQLTRIGLKTVLERTDDIKVIGEAENGEEAIRKVGELKPDVVLMDVGMPIMDGIEAVNNIQQQYQNVNTIMLTSHDNEQDILASLSAGASGYCLKDVDPHRLYSAIRAVNGGDIWLDSSIASRVMKIQQARMMKTETSHGEHAKGETAVQHATAGGASGKGQPQLPPLPDALSPREMEVLSLLVEGLSNQEIADKLIISLATAKTHVRNILNKLAVDDRTQAAVQAMRRGLV